MQPDKASAVLAQVLCTLLDEALSGPPPGVECGNFTTGPGTGLAGALRDATPEMASLHIASDRPSLAGHAAHVLLALASERLSAQGDAAEPDWASAWLAAPPDKAALDALAGSLEAQVRATEDFIRAADITDASRLERVVASAVHAAYHLGAMRQILRLLQPPAADQAIHLTAFASYEASLNAITGEQAMQVPQGAPTAQQPSWPTWCSGRNGYWRGCRDTPCQSPHTRLKAGPT